MLSKKPRQETDLPWKYILSKYFKSFMEFCWANRASEINWKKKPKFLDKELIKITKEAATGNRVVDKLIEVELIDGNRCCILIHLEVQAAKHEDFSKRMFIYRYRLYDWSDGQPVASMAILLDNDLSWRPCSYSQNLWDSEISVKFPIFNKKEVIELFRFIDWIISLPKESEAKFMRNLDKLEKEEFDKNFICPAEQIWMEQGLEEAAQNMVKEGLPDKLIIKITKITSEKLKELKSEFKKEQNKKKS